ncbi:unnamed protein product [Ambrosiozyma monospora]|uniref:Unnamed protein product n=1 Tax=Ambrosiozyma monospora TaxID=43982 RepID=A0A9W6YUF0_AMBMO|nr:unnamed protein product [Ambrosiozyma monospora]
MRQSGQTQLFKYFNLCFLSTILNTINSLICVLFNTFYAENMYNLACCLLWFMLNIYLSCQCAELEQLHSQGRRSHDLTDSSSGIILVSPSTYNIDSGTESDMLNTDQERSPFENYASQYHYHQSTLANDWSPNYLFNFEDGDLAPNGLAVRPVLSRDHSAYHIPIAHNHNQQQQQQQHHQPQYNHPLGRQACNTQPQYNHPLGRQACNTQPQQSSRPPQMANIAPILATLMALSPVASNAMIIPKLIKTLPKDINQFPDEPIDDLIWIVLSPLSFCLVLNQSYCLFIWLS